jgi:hypothetical protein
MSRHAVCDRAPHDVDVMTIFASAYANPAEDTRSPVAELIRRLSDRDAAAAPRQRSFDSA